MRWWRIRRWCLRCRFDETQGLRDQSGGKVLRQVSGNGDAEHRSDEYRADHGAGAGCVERDSFDVGDAVLPICRNTERILCGAGDRVGGEFEQGNPDYPIWSGCFFGSAAEVPALALATPPGLQGVVIQTVGQNTLMISDTPGPTGGILLKTTTGAMISISDTGI